MTNEQRIYRIVLTGGPCAGKTSLRNKLSREAKAVKDLKVIIAPEAATTLKHSGINFLDAGADDTFQDMIIDQQILSEAMAWRTAHNYLLKHPTHKVIIVCDRGIMDGEAYFNSPAEYAQVLNRHSLTRDIVYERYDAVISLRSAAIGALSFYTTKDGTPRDESPEEAAKLDKKVCEAWQYHKCYYAIDNSFKFPEKLDKAVAKIFEVAKIELPKKICRRYLCKMPDMFKLLDRSSHLEVCVDKTFFLKQTRDDLFSAIRIRMVGENATYYMNEQRWKAIESPNSMEKTLEAVYDTTFEITEKEVMHSLIHVDSTIPSLEKMMYSFHIADEIFCELNIYQCNSKNAYLRVFFDCAEEDIEKYLPIVEGFFTILKEVNYERTYTEYEIARTNGKVLNPS